MKHTRGDWLETAEGLPVGAKIKTLCDFPECIGRETPSMLISHSENGYTKHCFRCNGHTFKPHGQRRIADLIRHKREYEMIKSKVVALPKDYTLDIPTKAMTWFLQYGVSPELARDHAIGYSEYYDRIVLPVYNDDYDNLDAVQLRSVNNRKPKYLNPQGANVSRALFKVGESKGARVVVEDILSAIKVGKVVPTASILGTTLTDERALRIAKENHTVVLWLDSDKAGQKGTRKAAKKLQMLGVKVYKVETQTDPKTYNLSEIEDKLKRIIECHS